MTSFDSVRGKVAVVTGASSGIGVSIAKVYAENGVKVVLAARREEKGQKIVEEIRSLGGEAVFCKADVSKEEDVQRIMQCALDTYGKLNILVNNAGASTVLHPVHEYETEEFRRITDIDYIGVFMCIKYGVRAMIQSDSKDCAIINISSVEGIKPTANLSAYSGAKRAVISLTQTASLDYSRHDITVNCICPGGTDTEIFSTISPEQRDLTQSQIPAGRFASPEEIAYPALFLASDLARFITGAIIPVDGATCAGSYSEIPWEE